MLKSIVLLIFMTPALFAATQMEVITFNVRWFGLTVDDPRSPSPKPRDPAVVRQQIASMADFMKKVINPQSVIVFQEVVDLNALRTILPPNWSCDGYRHQNKYHQHVVVCVSPIYRIVNVPYDRNMIIEEVASDAVWSRPAVRADIVDRSGNRVLRVVGTHLKSAPNFAAERVRQMKVIAQDLRKGTMIPTIVLGDMNSYAANQTGQKLDDAVLLERTLQLVDPTFVHLKHKEPYTYRSADHKSQFDHMYFNRGIKVLKGPDVFNVCSQTVDGQGYLNFKYYLANVSDHCAVKAIIQVGN